MNKWKDEMFKTLMVVCDGIGYIRLEIKELRELIEREKVKK